MVTTQKGKDLATSNWLRDTVAQGSPLPYADYVALPELKGEVHVTFPLRLKSRLHGAHHELPLLYFTTYSFSIAFSSRT